jgi:hypothetical protein
MRLPSTQRVRSYLNLEPTLSPYIRFEVRGHGCTLEISLKTNVHILFHKPDLLAVLRSKDRMLRRLNTNRALSVSTVFSEYIE